MAACLHFGCLELNFFINPSFFGKTKTSKRTSQGLFLHCLYWISTKRRDFKRCIPFHDVNLIQELVQLIHISGLLPMNVIALNICEICGENLFEYCGKFLFHNSLISSNICDDEMQMTFFKCISKKLSEPSNDREVELLEYTPLFATLSLYF